MKSNQFKVHDIYSSSLVFTCLCYRQNLLVESEECQANFFTHKFFKKDAGNLSDQFKSVFDFVFSFVGDMESVGRNGRMLEVSNVSVSKYERIYDVTGAVCRSLL